MPVYIDYKSHRFYVTSVIHDTSSIPHRIFFSAIQCVGPLGDLAKDETVQSIGLKIDIHKLLSNVFSILKNNRFWKDRNAVRAV